MIFSLTESKKYNIIKRLKNKKEVSLLLQKEPKADGYDTCKKTD